MSTLTLYDAAIRIFGNQKASYVVPAVGFLHTPGRGWAAFVKGRTHDFPVTELAFATHGPYNEF